MALNYVSDASRVDKSKAPQYQPGSHCGNCALYQGGTAESGPCPLYPGKRVANAAWCSSWTKKA